MAWMRSMIWRGGRQALRCTNFDVKGQIFGSGALCRRMGSDASRPGLSPRQKFLVFSLGGVGAGVLFGYFLTHREVKFKALGRQMNSYKIVPSGTRASKEEFLLAERPPAYEVARQVRYPSDDTGLKVTLFQFQTCPFCCKVRAFLDYYGISYDVVEVNSVSRKQIKWSKYRKVPILVIETKDGKIIQLNDSNFIISSFYSFLVDRSQDLLDVASYYPAIVFYDQDGKEKTERANKYFIMYGEKTSGRSQEEVAQERKWRAWVDDVYVHMISPNIYRTPTEALQAFHWFSKAGDWEAHFSIWERFMVLYLGAAAMFFIGRKLKTKYGLKQDVRQSLYDETRVWLKEVKQQGGTFLGGDSPNLADLAMFGVMNAMEGCETFQDLCANTSIKSWYDDVKRAVEKQ